MLIYHRGAQMTQPVLKAGTGVSGEGKHRIGLDSPIEWLLATTPGEKGVILWMCIQYPITAMRIFRFFYLGTISIPNSQEPECTCICSSHWQASAGPYPFIPCPPFIYLFLIKWILNSHQKEIKGPRAASIQLGESLCTAVRESLT